jgi:hypothetical protein
MGENIENTASTFAHTRLLAAVKVIPLPASTAPIIVRSLGVGKVVSILGLHVVEAGSLVKVRGLGIQRRSVFLHRKKIVRDYFLSPQPHYPSPQFTLSVLSSLLLVVCPASSTLSKTDVPQTPRPHISETVSLKLQCILSAYML